MHSPLDLLYEGWMGKQKGQLNVSAWVEELTERLELIRDVVHLGRARVGDVRRESYVKGTVSRSFNKGNLVLARTPGLLGKLEKAWTGPWVVQEKCGPVTYRVRSREGGAKGKVVHLNTIKKIHGKG